MSGEKTQAQLISKTGSEVMLKGIKARGEARGQLLSMILEQTYLNPTDTNTEITYTFPLPFGATLMDVEVELNGTKLTGCVVARREARRKYEQAIEDGNTGVMLERCADGSFSLDLGNLLAKETCRITIHYTQVLSFEQGQVRLMLPTTIAPRYGDAVQQGRFLPHQVPTNSALVEYPFELTLRLCGSLANAGLASPSHRIRFSRDQDDVLVTLDQSAYLDRDFILVISDLKAPLESLVCKDPFMEGQLAAVAFLNPDFAGMSKNRPVQVKILVDCSGSMGGDSIEAAKSSLLEIIHSLDLGDSFSLSRFGSSVEHRGQSMWLSSFRTRLSAERWVKGLKADLGGTEMEGALRSTFAIESEGTSDVLLITDGEIQDIEGVIATAKGSNHRVFVVAIGASPAEGHLRRLAYATGGTCDFVAPGEEAGPAITRMFHRLHSPRASNLRIHWPASIPATWQQALPASVFAGDSIAINTFAAVTEPTEISGSVELWGTLDDSREERLIASSATSLQEHLARPISRLVARAQIRELEHVPKVLVKDDLSTVAVRYQLVTELTNYILVHDRAEDRAQEMPQGHSAPHMLPAGWGGTGSVMFSRKDATATPSVWRSAPAVYRRAATPDLSINACVSSFAGSTSDDLIIPAFLRKASGFDDMDDNIPFEKPKSKKHRIDRKNPQLWTAPSSTTDPTDKGRLPHLVGLTPAGLAQWLAMNNPVDWPTTFTGLAKIGLPIAVCEWLEFDFGAGMEEERVVDAFLGWALFQQSQRPTGFLHWLRSVRLVFTQKDSKSLDELAERLKVVLHLATRRHWPASILQSPTLTS